MARVKGNDFISAPAIYISESDLQDEQMVVAVKRLGLDAILNKVCGFNDKNVVEGSDKFYEVMKCKHRNLQGELVDCNRYAGVERIDDDWIENGNPSEDAKIAARGDLSYVREIQKMSKRVVSN